MWDYEKGSCGDSSAPLDLFDEQRLQLLAGCTVVASALSIAGSLFIILTYHALYTTWFLFSRVTRVAPFASHILYWLSACDLLTSLLYLAGASAQMAGAKLACHRIACIAVASLQHYFSLGSVLWAAGLALNVQRIMLTPSVHSATEDRAKLRAMHLGIWGACFINVLVLGAAGALGDAGTWCWIKEEYLTARLVSFYLPLCFVLLYHLATYLKVRQRLRRLQREVHDYEGDSTALVSLGRRFRNYALVFAVVWLSQLLNRLQSVVKPNEPIFGLYLAQSALGPLQGLGNAFVYGLSPRVRALLACPSEKLPKWLRRRRESGVLEAEPPVEASLDSAGAHAAAHAADADEAHAADADEAHAADADEAHGGRLCSHSSRTCCGSAGLIECTRTHGAPL